LGEDDPHRIEDAHSSIELYHVQFNALLRRLRHYRRLFELVLELGKFYSQQVEDLRQDGEEGVATLSSRIRSQERRIAEYYYIIKDDQNDVLRDRSRTGRDLDELIGMSEPESWVNTNIASCY
jgi:phosphatidylserine/phosphatidylglycerophosphate/cardiolipin synthase-like enzyme